MKKFLTVLLVIAVMFTFSFGSAFAATSNTQANLIKQAEAYAKAQLPEAVKKAIELTVKNGANAYITEAAWEAATADIVDLMEADYETLTEGYLANADAISTPNWDKYDVAYAANALYTAKGYDYVTLANWFAGNNSSSIAAAKEQYKMDLAKAVAKYDKIDVASLYSNTTPSTGATYYAQAVKAIADSKEALNDYYLPEGKVKAYFAGSVADLQSGSNEIASVVANGNATVGATGIGDVKYEGTSVVKYYYLKDNTIKMMEQEAADNTVDAATTAALKAQIAKNVANYVTDVTKTAPAGYTKAEWADLYSEVYGFIAEELPTELAASTELGWTLDQFAVSEVADFDTAITVVKNLEAYAAKVAAEKNAEGEAVRDAAAIAKLVKAAKLDKYTATVGLAYADDTNAFTTVYNDIVALSVSIDGAAAKLAFDKDAAKAALEDELDGIVDAETYYDLELAAVKAAYEKAYAAIDAAKKASEFTGDASVIQVALDKEVAKIKTATQVNGLFTSGAMKTELDKQVKALNDYLTYKNSPLNGASYEDAWVLSGNETELVRDYYIEAGARTAAEMKAMTGVVEAVAASLPTVADVAAAEKAAKAAIKAIPAVAKITSADKAVIVAAVEAIEAYEDLCDVAGVAKTSYEVDDEVAALYAAMQEDFNLAFAKADKTDKAAMLAIKAEVKAANKEMADIFANDLVNPAATVLNNMKAAEAAAVRKAIAAIPFTVTEADKAVVEAARALYDAYVAEYTNIYDAANGFVADDFDYVALGRAEAALGLNAEDPAYSVEALKITAKSSAKKGSITVKWTVEGDTSAVEGYEIWKSTKHSSGYKKMFTTTKLTYKNTKGLEKGTRYFYKVRAIAHTAEGEKVKSDFSNKARRIAK